MQPNLNQLPLLAVFGLERCFELPVAGSLAICRLSPAQW